MVLALIEEAVAADISVSIVTFSTQATLLYNARSQAGTTSGPGCSSALALAHYSDANRSPTRRSTPPAWTQRKADQHDPAPLALQHTRC